jgi:YjbE family integral membrane protein
VELADLVSLSQIIIIDFVLAGDNAIVVGMAASRVHPALRVRVIFWGVAGAVVLRILFAVVATQLLTIVGLTLAGGILLLWVCWKMYREIRLTAPKPAFAGGVPGESLAPVRNMTFRAALVQIIIADVSMSLDNVLAVAGAAKGQIWVLAYGGGRLHGAALGVHREAACALSLDHVDRACDCALRCGRNGLDRHASNRLSGRQQGRLRWRRAADAWRAAILSKRVRMAVTAFVEVSRPKARRSAGAVIAAL